MTIARGRAVTIGLMALLCAAGSGCAAGPRHTASFADFERSAFAADHSALVFLDNFWLFVRKPTTPPSLVKLPVPPCMVEAVDRLAVSPGGETVAAYGLFQGPARPRCFLDLATGRTWAPKEDGLLAWVGAEPVIIPDDKLPAARELCNAFTTKQGPVVACLQQRTDEPSDGGDILVKRFRGLDLTPWGDLISLPLRYADQWDRPRMNIDWEGRMVTWVQQNLDVVELREREAKVSHLGPWLTDPESRSLMSAVFEPTGRRLLIVTWQYDDRYPPPFGHLHILGEDGEVQRTIGVDGPPHEGYWEEPAAVWLMSESRALRVELPARDDQRLSTQPP